MEYQQKGGHFEVKQINHIGEGRFGNVYKAMSSRFKKEFALKEISKGKLTTDSMFKNEVHILSLVIHPNIVKIYGYFETENAYNLVMQYCSKGSLKTEIKKNGCFDCNKFSHVFRQILEAINYSHQKKIAHRDLKPDNILFDEYGRIQIADWGQAILVENDEGMIDTYCGTLSYASPECISKQPLNAYKNDMYSIGVCMYFTVFGQDPWTEKVPVFKKQQIINNNYRLLPNTIDRQVSDVIYSLLHQDQFQRPSAEELLKLPLFHKNVSTPLFGGLKTSKKNDKIHLNPNTLIQRPRHFASNERFIL